MFIRKTQRAAAGLLVVMSMLTSSVAFADGNESESHGETAARRWTSSTPATLPNLSGPSIAYDETNSTIVLFGGVTTSGVYKNETYLSTDEGVTWTKVTPAHSPTARAAAWAVWDAAIGRVMIFGGSSVSGGTTTYYNDTWTWSGSDWTQVVTANAPAARADHGIAYDASRSLVYVFGGRGASTYKDLWSFNGTNWTQVTTTGTTPPTIHHFAMSYDPDLQANVIHGGCTDTGCNAKSTFTWVQDGAAISKAPITSRPEAMGTHAMGPAGTGKGLLLTGEAGIGKTYQLTGSTTSTLKWAKVGAEDNSGPQDALASMVLIPGSGNVLQFTGTKRWKWDYAPTAPSAPAAPSVEVASSTSVTVSWSAPSSDGNSPITSYTVTSTPGNKTCTATAPTTTCVVSGLSINTSYTFTVKATNAIGTSAASSPSGSQRTPKLPGAPETVAGSPSADTEINVSWSAPSDDGGIAITSYQAKAYPSNKTCTATAPATTCTVTGLATKTNYTFTVKAINAVGSGPWSSASSSVGTANVPSSPKDPQASRGARSATVSWSAPDSDGGSTITSYTVKSTPGNKTCTATAPSRSCTVTGLYANAEYTFTVTATNGAGTSAPSTASSSVTTADVPTAPRNVTLTAGQFGSAKGQFTVSWNPPTSNGGSDIVSYSVLVTPGNYTCTVNAPTTSCVINGDGVNGLSYATQYTASVVADNGLSTGATGTGTGTLSVTPSAPAVGPASFTYAPNYYGVQEATMTVYVACPTYWGSSVGTVSIRVTGSSSYPTSSSVDTSTTGCDRSVTFTGLPTYGSYTVTATASNDDATSSNGVLRIGADGPLPTPKILVTYTPSTQSLLVSTSSQTDGNGFTFTLVDRSTSTTLCTSRSGNFVCTETVSALSGTGVILTANLRLTVTSSAGYTTQVFDYPVSIVRLACPVSNSNCTTIVGNYYKMNRANLVGMNLSGLDFSNSFISNSYFGGTTLSGVDFSRATLQSTDLSSSKDNGVGVNFSNATLIAVAFNNARLTGNMTGAAASQMSNNFTTSNVYPYGGAIYNGVWVAKGMAIFNKNLTGGNFSSLGDLSNMTLLGVNLSNVNFSGVSLNNSYFGQCNLSGANFSNTTLNGVSSAANTGTMSSLSTGYRDVAGMIFGPGVVLVRKNLRGLDLSNLNLTGAVLINSDLSNANFTNSNLTAVNVQQISVGGVASFNPGLLSGANFTNAIMTNMWGISDSATYSGSTYSISVTGSAPAALPRRVVFDAVNRRLVLL